MQELPELLGNSFCYDEQTFSKNSSYKICWYVPYFNPFRLKTEQTPPLLDRFKQRSCSKNSPISWNTLDKIWKLFKVYNRGTGTMSEICSKLITKPIFTWPSTISSEERGFKKFEKILRKTSNVVHFR